MSEKQYTADEVARQVLSKVKEVADLNKGLFAEKAELKSCSPSEWKPETKEQCFNEIRYKVQRIKELKELSWTVEQEAPNAKDIFEKEFAKVKEEIASLLRRCNSLKKDEFNDEEAEVIKAAESVDEIWKAEGDIKGVNKPVGPGGQSKAGVHTRGAKGIANTSNAALHGLKVMDQSAAKNAHKKVISEMKEIKPNLPKSETDVCKEETVPGEVAAVVGNTTYKNGKLQNFMNEKKKKKTADMEKKLGIQSAPISR